MSCVYVMRIDSQDSFDACYRRQSVMQAASSDIPVEALHHTLKGTSKTEEESLAESCYCRC